MLGHQVECPDWKYQFATNKNDFQIYQVENSNFQIISVCWDIKWNGGSSDCREAVLKPKLLNTELLKLCLEMYTYHNIYDSVA